MGILDYFRKGNTVGGVRAADKGKSPIGIWLTDSTSEDIKCSGYTSLADNPDVFTACRKISMLISSMPVMLMQNGESGDERIFNELSRKIDIDPNPDMTRHTLFEAICMNLLLYGRGNSVAVPKTSRGFLWGRMYFFVANFEKISYDVCVKKCYIRFGEKGSEMHV